VDRQSRSARGDQLDPRSPAAVNTIQALQRLATARPALMKAELIVAFGPAVVDNGVVARVVELPDGSGRVETWSPGKGWVKGGASLDEFFLARPVSPELASRLGIPIESPPLAPA